MWDDFAAGVEMGYGSHGTQLPPWVVGITSAISAQAIQDYNRAVEVAANVVAPTAPAPPTMPPPTLPPPVSPPATTSTPPATPPAPTPRAVEGELLRRPGPSSVIWEDYGDLPDYDPWEGLEDRIKDRRAIDVAVERIAPVVRRLGRVLGPIGGIFDIAIPSELGSGELSTEDMIEQVLRDAEQSREPVFPPPPSPPLPPMPSPSIPPPSFPQPETSWPAPIPSPMPLPMPLPLPSPPVTGRQPRPSTPSTTSTGPASATPPWWQLISRTIPRAASRTRSFTWPSVSGLTSSPSWPSPSQPSASGAPSPATTTGAQPSARQLTEFQRSGLTSTPTQTRERRCECKPKRKKARKCRTRLQVVWKSGPNKGKAAGTRCASWVK